MNSVRNVLIRIAQRQLLSRRCYRSKNPAGMDYDASWKQQNDGQANTDGPRPMVGGGMAPTGPMVAR